MFGPFRGVLMGLTFLLPLILVVLPGCGENLEAILPPGAGAAAGAGLPEDAVILNLAEATVRAPFVLQEDAAAAGAMALVLPKGARSADGQGRALLKMEVKAAGSYYAWAHVRWRDACSNSLILTLDETTEPVVVEDAVYERWHWVKAGQHPLRAGAHAMAVAEREDGVAMDQLLFTRDAAFVPIGVMGGRAGGAEVRRFADDFSRSPGHGIGDWDLVGGKWQIAFSFDPNRIPHQYALVGEEKEGEAVALVQGMPWNGCRLSFSYLPRREGAAGALLDRARPRPGGQAGEAPLRVAFRVAEGQPSRLEVTGAGMEVSKDIGGAVRLGQWHRVAITDPERTVLDLVASPRLFGTLGVGLETLEAHLGRLDMDRLVGYALRYEVGSVIKRLGWMLEALGVPESTTEPLHAYPVRAYYSLDPTRPPGGTPAPRWRVRNNLPQEGNDADR